MWFNAHAQRVSQRALLEVCFEPEFETRYRYALVKKKWSEKRELGPITHWGYVRRRRNGCQQQQRRCPLRES